MFNSCVAINSDDDTVWHVLRQVVEAEVAGSTVGVHVVVVALDSDATNESRQLGSMSTGCIDDIN